MARITLVSSRRARADAPVVLPGTACRSNRARVLFQGQRVDGSHHPQLSFQFAAPAGPRWCRAAAAGHSAARTASGSQSRSRRMASVRLSRRRRASVSVQFDPAGSFADLGQLALGGARAVGAIGPGDRSALGWLRPGPGGWRSLPRASVELRSDGPRPDPSGVRSPTTACSRSMAPGGGPIALHDVAAEAILHLLEAAGGHGHGVPRVPAARSPPGSRRMAATVAVCSTAATRAARWAATRAAEASASCSKAGKRAASSVTRACSRSTRLASSCRWASPTACSLVASANSASSRSRASRAT